MMDIRDTVLAGAREMVLDNENDSEAIMAGFGSHFEHAGVETQIWDAWKNWGCSDRCRKTEGIQVC